MKKMMMNLWKDESGQALTEYGLIIALVAVGAIAVISGIGSGLVSKLEQIRTALAGS